MWKLGVKLLLRSFTLMKVPLKSQTTPNQQHRSAADPNHRRKSAALVTQQQQRRKQKNSYQPPFSLHRKRGLAICHGRSAVFPLQYFEMPDGPRAESSTSN